MRARDLPLHYNASEILDGNLEERPDKVALVSAERSMTFGEAAAEANRVGNALLKLGVRAGDCVALLSLDGAEWVSVFFGTLRLGAISVGLNTLLTEKDYAYMLDDCRARVLVVHETLWSKVASVVSDSDTIEHVIIIGAGNDHATGFAEWIVDASDRLPAARTHREDFCTLNYSSGTTGEPKGILHAHKDLALTAVHSGQESLGLKEDDRTFAAAKLFFTFGTGGNLVFPWTVGASIVLFSGSPRVATDILATIERFEPTVLFHTPTGYAMSLALPDLERRYDLSSLRLCVSGGERLPAAIWEEWKARTGLTILDGIGATEVFHNFLCNPENAVRPGSSGKPVAGYDARIVDDAGAELEVGEVGNLMIRGESVALSYWHQYERSREAFRGEWFFTGDKYRVDEDGYYWNEGRTDDMLKVGGIWVSPLEVEGTLIGHEAVAECAVVGVRDGSELVKPKAYVVLRSTFEPGDALERALIEHCRERMAAYKRPRRIAFVTELPKTATGKIKRYELRRETS